MNKLIVLLSVLCLNTSFIHAQIPIAKNSTLADKQSSKFRIIGYLRETAIENGKAAGFDFSRINYLNIAFINPRADGSFPALPGLLSFVMAAHKENVKVLASLGGGLAPAYFLSLLSDSMRNDFIRKTVALADDNQLDGIDVDLEGERIDNNYESFVAGLSAALKQPNKLLTAAVATAYKSRYTDKALAFFDFINIMSYDKTGPWRPADPGQHAPYSMAVEDLDYWTITKGIAREKLSLGVPFYGYGFRPNAPADMSFNQILTKYPGSESTDSVSVAGGGTVYYNGIATIKAKTMLALQKAGGIMIWQLTGDADGNNSLLNAINTVIHSADKQ